MKKLTAILILGLPITAGSLAAMTLHEAAYAGFNEGVEVLITQGKNVNEVSAEGFTPIHAAAASCKTEVIRTLLAAGADAKKGDANNNQTALEMAIEVSEYLQKLKEQLVLAQQMKEKGSEPLILRIKKKDFLVGDNEELIELVTSREHFLERLEEGKGTLHFTEKAVLEGCEGTINLLVDATTEE